MSQQTEILKHTELLIGSTGVILSLFFAAFLFLNRKNFLKANLFLALYLFAFSLRIGKSLFFNYFPIDEVVRNCFLSVLLTIGPSVWFYVRFLYQPNYRIKNQRILIHYVPFIVVLLLCWVIPNNGSYASGVFYKSLIGHVVLYSIFALFWILKQPVKRDLEKKPNFKSWLIYFVSVTLFMMFVYFLIAEAIIPYYLGTAFLFSVVIILFSIRALRSPLLFKVVREKYAASTLKDENISEYIAQLDNLMTEEKLYLNPELTLTSLSGTMGISSKLLSQVINQAQRCNYSQYIAAYRVEEAKQRLSSTEHKHLKIAAIAYDSGFNSLSSFNAAFRKLTKMTAIQYRRQHG